VPNGSFFPYALTAAWGKYRSLTWRRASGFHCDTFDLWYPDFYEDIAAKLEFIRCLRRKLAESPDDGLWGLALFVLPGAGHNHNVASNRKQLWDRLALWARTVVPADPASGMTDKAVGELLR